MPNKMAKIDAIQKQNENVLYYEANGGGIDTTNVLASNVSPYTATEDCFVVCDALNDVYIKANVVIDSITVFRSRTAGTCNAFFLKKGQTAGREDTSFAKYKIYGIKHN